MGRPEIQETGAVAFLTDHVVQQRQSRPYHKEPKEQGPGIIITWADRFNVTGVYIFLGYCIPMLGPFISKVSPLALNKQSRHLWGWWGNEWM